MNDIEIISNRTLRTPSGEVLETGRWLGRKQAFAELAGRCSAADAECLRQIREQKMYRRLKMTWREFCQQHLGISRSAADQTIRRLEQFGPSYFVLAQATGMSENDYRRISYAVHDQKLLHAGEEIPINAENAPRLNAAVEQLRRESAAALPVPEADAAVSGSTDLPRALDKLQRTLMSAVEQISRLHALPLECADREQLMRTVVDQLHRMPLFQLTEVRATLGNATHRRRG